MGNEMTLFAATGVRLWQILLQKSFALGRVIQKRTRPHHIASKRPLEHICAERVLYGPHDLPLERDAVGALSGHGFHPLKAQLTLSNQ
jgi:hypothetical protein